MAEYSVEVHFAQKLACNEKRDRDKAVKRLKKYIEAKSSVGKGFDQDEMMKLWKGLFFCMWMCDKPLVQEELAAKISKLVFAFTRLDGALNFISTFYTTMKREWYDIDRLRLDKFMLLMRCILQESFELLKSHRWKRSVMKKFLKIMNLGPLSASDKCSVNGIRFHLMDIYLEVLSSVGAAELTPKQNLNFLQPFCKLLTRSKSDYVLERAQTRVFYAIIYDSELGQSMFPSDDNVEEDEEKEELLKFDYASIADVLFAEASQKECRIRNRNFVYTLVKKFKDLVNGRFPLQPDLSSGSDNELTETDMEAAVMRMQEEEWEDRKRKLWVKKHKRAFPDSQDDVNEKSDDVAEKQIETADAYNMLQLGVPSAKSQKQKTKHLKKKRKREVEESLERPGEIMDIVSLSKNAILDNQLDNENDATAESHIETANKHSSLQCAVVVTHSEGKQDKLLKKNKRKRMGKVRTEVKSDEQIDYALLDNHAFIDIQVDNEDVNEDAKKYSFTADLHNTLHTGIADSKLERKPIKHLKKKRKRNHEVEQTAEKFSQLTNVTQAISNADLALNEVNAISLQAENSKQINNIVPSVTEPHGRKTSEATSSLKQKKAKCKNKDSHPEIIQGSYDIYESEKEEPKGQVKTSISTKSSTVNSGTHSKVKIGTFVSEKKTAEKTAAVSRGEETFASFQVNVTPPAAFVRRAYSKTMSMSEPQKKVKRVSGISTWTPNEHKKVKFVLSNNTRHDHQDYKSAVKASPQIPYDGSRNPTQGLLKSVSLA